MINLFFFLFQVIGELIITVLVEHKNSKKKNNHCFSENGTAGVRYLKSPNILFINIELLLHYHKHFHIVINKVKLANISLPHPLLTKSEYEIVILNIEESEIMYHEGDKKSLAYIMWFILQNIQYNRDNNN